MGGLGFGAWGLRPRTLSLRLKLGIWGCGLRVQGLGFGFYCARAGVRRC